MTIFSTQLFLPCFAWFISFLGLILLLAENDLIIPVNGFLRTNHKYNHHSHPMNSLMTLLSRRNSVVSAMKESSSLEQEGSRGENRNRQQRPRQQRRYSPKKVIKSKKQTDQFHKVLKSIEYYGTKDQQAGGIDDTEDHGGASPGALECVKDLQKAITKEDFDKVGQQLERLDIMKTENRPILERLMKATALCGLTESSTKICHHILDEIITLCGNEPNNHQQHLPSHISYSALCNSLRYSGKLDELEQVLQRLADAAKAIQNSTAPSSTTTHESKMVNAVAFNTLLASLCQCTNRPDDRNLEKAYKYIESPEATLKNFMVHLDTTSYNTVLQTAAKVGNITISDEIWRQLTKSTSSLQPDRRSYNFRLQSTKFYDDQLALFDEMMSSPTIQPDRYTIDLMILPLIRAGRIGDVKSLIETFITHTSDEEIIKDAFSAFLSTLVKRDELSSARALFDTYVMPRVVRIIHQKQSKQQTSLSNHPFTIQPHVRHFNTLIDGYRRAADNYAVLQEGKSRADDNIEIWEKKRVDRQGKRDKIWNQKDTECVVDESDDNSNEATIDENIAQSEGRRLYRILRKAEMKPDAYTVTSMMGLCKSSEELLMLMQDAKGIMTPAVARAAITNFGRLGDPSSSCAFFDAYVPLSRDLRVWNVLLGALTEGAKVNNTIIDLDSSPAADIDDGKMVSEGTGGMVSTLINGKRCSDAVLQILNVMRESNDKASSRAPNPNSQTYCLAASALQYESKGAVDAMELFQSAIEEGIPADGRFVNAIFRCFGDDIEGALDCWKNAIRKECFTHEERTRQAAISPFRSTNKNLIAAYNGLLYVCGRALRPDIALRLAFAMDREGIEPNEVCLNNYRAGKRLRRREMELLSVEESNNIGLRRTKLLPQINLVEQYENLLYVECTKYDKNNMRMAKDRRVRIIV